MTPDRFIAAAFRELTVPEPDGGKVVGVSVQLVMDRAAELARESVGVTDGPDVVAWIDGERIWKTHRAPPNGLHALVLASRSVGWVSEREEQ